MIQVILGKKGSGKSKQVVEMANKLVGEAEGDIVYIDDDSRCMLDVRHEIRFVNCSEYNVDDVNKFYGFVCGMISQDFDISHIFIDGLKNMVHSELTEMEVLFKDLDDVLKRNNVKAVIVVSADPETAPEFLKAYAI
ncbi:MAG: hypothetical protein AB1Z19_03400 [Eubacteriales bacterium]